MKLIRLLAGILTEISTIATSAGASDNDKVPATDANGRLDATFMPGGAPVNTSAGAGDAGKLPKLDAGGKLASSMMPAGLGADVRTVVASEAISAGNLVNLWSNAGTINARKADATVAGKEAHGFAQAAIASAASGEITFDGTISGLTGLTVGARYFLATTAGGITTTPPSAAGNIVQVVGVAPSATELIFEADNAPVTLA